MLGLKPTKEEVFKAFRKARLEIMIPRVIRSAWRGSGIWPRDREKPLKSKYVLLEKEGVVRQRPGESRLLQRASTPDLLGTIVQTPIKTPSRGQELLISRRKLAATDPTFNMPAQRLFARKASKALDEATGQIAHLQAQNDYLRAKIKIDRPNKRKAVAVAPNEAFVRMVDVRRTKRRLRGRVLFNDDDSDEQIPEGAPRVEDTEIEDCIMVKNTKNKG